MQKEVFCFLIDLTLYPNGSFDYFFKQPPAYGNYMTTPGVMGPPPTVNFPPPNLSQAPPPPPPKASTSEPVASQDDDPPPPVLDESTDPDLKEFDEQFKGWEDQFEQWKKDNAGHPDKDALIKSVSN